MALLWFDGFESYGAAADMNRVTDPTFYCNNTQFSATYKRYGDRGIAHNAWDHYLDITMASAPSSTTCVVGMAIYFNNASTPSISTPFLHLRDGSGNMHVGLYADADRNIVVKNNGGTTLGTTSGVTLNAYAWYYIEVKAIIDDSVGQVIIRIDEAVVLTTTADKDTLNGSDAYVQGLRVQAVFNIPPTLVDDFYFLDGSGDAPHNDFLGDIRVDISRVDGAGSHTEFTPSAGSNYENVDEEPGPDSDTTYNDGDTTDDEDSYALEDLPAPSGTTIYGVKSQITVRKTDAGARRCKIITRSGGSDYLGDEETLSDSYQTFTTLYEDNPDDSAAWEDADVNGMEVGIKVTA